MENHGFAVIEGSQAREVVPLRGGRVEEMERPSVRRNCYVPSIRGVSPNAWRRLCGSNAHSGGDAKEEEDMPGEHVHCVHRCLPTASPPTIGVPFVYSAVVPPLAVNCGLYSVAYHKVWQLVLCGKDGQFVVGWVVRVGRRIEL